MAVVHVGDVLSRAVLIGSGGDDSIPVVNEDARDQLSLDPQLLDRVLGETFRGLRRGRAFFDLLKDVRKDT